MMRRASIFGGSWLNDENAGSRHANLGNWADNSNDNIGARGRSDDRFPALQRSRPCRPTISTKVGGQPGHPASANTFHDPVQRGVAHYFMRRDPRPAFSIVRQSAGFVPFEPRRIADIFSHERQMGRKYRNLIASITSDENLQLAYRRTARGKRVTPGFLEFKEFSPLNLDALAADMRRGSYEQGEAHQFVIHDPKYRVITALPFRDRVAQHALCAVIGPIFDRTLLPRTFACRPGKGTHAGAIALQADIRRLSAARPQEPLRFLKTDFSRYFASIDRAVLWGLIEAKISCRATLDLIAVMLPREGIGLPIGSLISQIFANVYGGIVDRHLQQDLGEKHWFRYMDDMVVLGHDSGHLRAVRDSIEQLSRDRLGLRFSKWSIAPVSRGVNFLGYRIWASHKLLRPDSVKRARRKIMAYRAAGDDVRLSKFLGAWTGHAGWADTANLMRALGLADDFNDNSKRQDHG